MRKRIVLAAVCILVVVWGTWVVLREPPSRVLPREHGPELRFMLSGVSPNDEFGGVVEILADCNGDGRPDLAVGAPYDDAGGVDAGRVTIFDHEGKTLYHLIDGRPGGCFGSAIRRVGDLDGDGVDDFAVGGSAQTANTPGRVVAYSGASRERLWDVEGGGPMSRFGHRIEGLGDVNGDGVPDVAVGAPGRASRSVSGSVSIRSGKDGSEIGAITELRDARLGFALALVVDLDRDGIDDLAVASRWADLRFFSPATGKEIAVKLDFLPTAHDVATLPGAGNEPRRLIIGSFRQGRRGGAEVVRFGRHGGGAPLIHAPVKSFGHSVASVGDVDGDGIDDIAVASPDADVGGLHRVGLVDVFSGSDRKLIYRYRGERAEDNLGYDVCGADLDGDGFSEVVLGTTVDDGTPGHVRVISFKRRMADGEGGFTTFTAPVDMGPGE